MKAIWFTTGLIIGLVLIVVGMVRVATSDAMKINHRSEDELKSTISSLVAETDALREERGPADEELVAKEAKLSDAEAELLVVRNGGNEARKNSVLLDNLPLFIAGVFSVGVAGVLYRYG